MLTTLVFIIIVLVILAIIIGINVSSSIDNPYLYMLFWLMFFITVATIVNIIGTGYFYMVMKNKKGKRGPRGEIGEKGDPGQLGKCNADCKNGLCSAAILEHILTVLNKEERAAGKPGNLQLSDIKNTFIKAKVKSICASAEYQKIAPVKGQDNLVNYLKTVWEDITIRLYKSGGLNYFKSVGAENDWDWVANNPWNEFKKYDVYYWGLGKEYRPQLKDKCTREPDSNNTNNEYPPKSYYTGSSSDYKMPERKAAKYSILSYINAPRSNSNTNSNTTDSTGGITIKNTRTAQKLDLYNAYTYEPNSDIKAKYESGKLAKLAGEIKPMSYLISIPGQPDSCYSFTKSGSIIPKPCDPYDSSQIYELEFNSAKPDSFKIKNTSANKFISNSANSKYLNTSNTGDTFSWM